MIERALELYAEEDILSALAFVAAQLPDIRVVQACGELVTKLYWEHKDLSAVTATALFGLSLGWKAAEKYRETEESTEVLSFTKAIAYNLASFTWPGWDEAGIQIGQNDLRLGLAAAHTNLRLAQELDKGLLPLSRAQWMLGAHFLAQKDYAQADRNFALSVASAATVGAQSEMLLSEGFRALVQQRAGLLQAAEVGEKLQPIKEHLMSLDGGAGLVAQLDTAFRVFT